MQLSDNLTAVNWALDSLSTINRQMAIGGLVAARKSVSRTISSFEEGIVRNCPDVYPDLVKSLVSILNIRARSSDVFTSKLGDAERTLTVKKNLALSAIEQANKAAAKPHACPHGKGFNCVKCWPKKTAPAAVADVHALYEFTSTGEEHEFSEMVLITGPTKEAIEDYSVQLVKTWLSDSHTGFNPHTVMADFRGTRVLRSFNRVITQEQVDLITQANEIVKYYPLVRRFTAPAPIVLDVHSIPTSRFAYVALAHLSEDFIREMRVAARDKTCVNSFEEHLLIRFSAMGGSASEKAEAVEALAHEFNVGVQYECISLLLALIKAGYDGVHFDIDGEVLPGVHLFE